jgi:hypothetical protein
MPVEMRRDAGPPEDPDAAAMARLQALFVRLDRLTVDDLGRIALSARDEERQAALRAEASRAAAASGRTALLVEAVEAARETVLRRFGEGIYRPTFAGLNWGISMGPAESRIAIVEAIEDAAAAAVVQDVLDPDVYEELSLDADHLVALARGGPPEGVLRFPWRSGLAMQLTTALVVAVIVVPLVLSTGVFGLLVAGTVGAILVAARRTGRGSGPRDRGGPRD